MKNNDSCYLNYPPIESVKTGDIVLKPPCRAPLAIIEAIRPYIEEKVVCEIGSALGDIALEMRKYAKFVFGIEIDKERVEYSNKRGLNTLGGDVLDLLPLEDAPDVYYMWMDPRPTREIFDAIGSGTIIMGGQLNYESEKAGYERGIEVKVLDEIHAENPGSRMIEVAYNEGEGYRESGTVVLLIVEKKGLA